MCKNQFIIAQLTLPFPSLPHFMHERFRVCIKSGDTSRAAEFHLLTFVNLGVGILRFTKRSIYH